jgi:hypothetical protein
MSRKATNQTGSPAPGLTAGAIVAIVGTIGCSDREELTAADRHAELFLKRGGGAIIDHNVIVSESSSPGHYRVIEELARECGGVDLDEIDKWLNQFQLPDGTGEADAIDRYLPEIDAAYYFGLSLGLRLAGGAR